MMKSTQIIAIVAVIALIGAATAIIVNSNLNDDDSEKTVAVKQSDGTIKEVKYKPERIVCLSTYACELLVIYNYQDKVVGVSNSTFTNPDLKQYYKEGKAKDVGSFNKPSISEIVELKPDLVIIYPGYGEVEKSLQDVKLSYIRLKCADASTMVMEADSLSKIVGAEKLGEKFVNYYKGIYDTMKAKGKAKDPKRSTYMESFSEYSAAGKSSAYYAMAVEVGAGMVYTENASTKISAAWLIEKNPDVIIKTPTLVSMEEEKAPALYNSIINRAGISEVSAVKNNDVHLICSQLFGGPRCFGGMLLVYDILYPGEDTKNWKVALEEYNTMFGVKMSTDGLYYTASA